MIKKLIPFLIREYRRELYDFSATPKYWDVVREENREYRIYLSGIPFRFIDIDGRLRSKDPPFIKEITAIRVFYTPPIQINTTPYTRAYARLRIFASNSHYAHTYLRIKTAGRITARIRIQAENYIAAHLRIETRGPVQARLSILTIHTPTRGRAKLRIVAENSNYASAMIRINTQNIPTPRAKLRIYIKSNKRRISMPDYYAFYNINTFGFLP
jgi:hypothetical protein